jgi:hypothetical protein
VFAHAAATPRQLLNSLTADRDAEIGVLRTHCCAGTVDRPPYRLSAVRFTSIGIGRWVEERDEPKHALP